ncbi:Type II restriction endonuclease [Clostridium botulinum A1 str. CFSAN002368]|nr:Type II restriction endonuclease [Clostridium botulinum A1 str. CFSAN002368]
MDNNTREKVENVLSDVMERIIDKRINKEPFKEEEISLKNPFGYRLVPIQIWKGSKFERSFVTSLGQAIFEQIAKIIAEGTGALAVNQYDTNLTINSWRVEKISEILREQRQSKLNPDWKKEVKDILSLTNSKYEDIKVKFDLYIKRQDGKEEYYSLKTVKPNLDQTEVAKRDMLYMKAGKEDSETYFALPFNPAGEGILYRKAHSIPYKLFDMDKDESVLIGSEFWNKVGNDKNTYNELLKLFEKVGNKYSKVIKKII